MAESQPTKVCSKCKAEKPISAFSKCSASKSGIRSRCRECCAQYWKQPHVKEWQKKKYLRIKDTPEYIDRIEKYKKSDKYAAAYLKKKRSRKGREYQIAFSRTDKGKKIAKRHAQSYLERNPKKHRARYMVNNAVRRGKIPRASTLLCSECGQQAHQYHHYLGYEQEHWFDIVPICRLCHGDEHAKHKLEDLLRKASRVNQQSTDEDHSQTGSRIPR